MGITKTRREMRNDYIGYCLAVAGYYSVYRRLHTNISYYSVYSRLHTNTVENHSQNTSWPRVEHYCSKEALRARGSRKTNWTSN